MTNFQPHNWRHILSTFEADEVSALEGQKKGCFSTLKIMIFNSVHYLNIKLVKNGTCELHRNYYSSNYLKHSHVLDFHLLFQEGYFWIICTKARPITSGSYEDDSHKHKQ